MVIASKHLGAVLSKFVKKKIQVCAMILSILHRELQRKPQGKEISHWPSFE